MEVFKRHGLRAEERGEGVLVVSGRQEIDQPSAGLMDSGFFTPGTINKTTSCHI